VFPTPILTAGDMEFVACAVCKCGLTELDHSYQDKCEYKGLVTLECTLCGHVYDENGRYWRSVAFRRKIKHHVIDEHGQFAQEVIAYVDNLLKRIRGGEEFLVLKKTTAADRRARHRQS
jgi:hypothetical protein